MYLNFNDACVFQHHDDDDKSKHVPVMKQRIVVTTEWTYTSCQDTEECVAL
jgi:hypothetical protein